MSLFIGNVSKKVTQKEFEDAFKSYGKCKIDLRKRYAFVQYESDRCAEEARNALQNVNFCGLRLNIQWSKNSGRFNENRGRGIEKSATKKRKSAQRERSWRRDDRWNRRSPSYQKRSSPTYSQNEDLQGFEPKCPRDAQLYKRIRTKREEGEMVEAKGRKYSQEGQAEIQ